jgi:hypothetical protein
LDLARGRVRSFERRVRVLRSAEAALRPFMEESDMRKLAVICAIEQLAGTLVTGDADRVAVVVQGAPAAVRPQIQGCATETEIRCLIRNNRVEQAVEKMSEAFEGAGTDLFVALLILKAAAMSLTHEEGVVLRHALEHLIANVPVHAVQAGEFLFRNCRPANTPVLRPSLETLWEASVKVGDIVSTGYFEGLLCNGRRRKFANRDAQRIAFCAPGLLREDARESVDWPKHVAQRLAKVNEVS